MPGTASTARTLKLTLAYDGTGFVGWQRQAA
jgi:tRNA U38,U39,U40 pseudouridine synthase TruA